MFQSSPTICTSIVLVDKNKNEYAINVTARRHGGQIFNVSFGLPKPYADYLLNPTGAQLLDACNKVADEFSTRNHFAVDPHPDAVAKLQRMLA